MALEPWVQKAISRHSSGVLLDTPQAALDAAGEGFTAAMGHVPLALTRLPWRAGVKLVTDMGAFGSGAGGLMPTCCLFTVASRMSRVESNHMKARIMLVLVLGLTGCDDPSAASPDSGGGDAQAGDAGGAGGAGGGGGSVLPGDASIPPLPPVVIPLDTAVGGKTQAQWAAEWWIDLYEIPDSQGWPGDTTGMNCANNQPAGDVWYLAGTWGGTEHRTCTIPAGRSLFFPLVNSMNNYPCRDPDLLPPPPPGENLRDYLMVGCAELIDLTTQLEVQVDGFEVPGLFDRRIQSELFTIRAHVSQLEFDSCATTLNQDAVTDGYWLMLAPLAPGRHTLHLRALTDDGNETFENEAFYELEVTP